MAGRPRTYDNEEELEKAINQYFQDIKGEYVDKVDEKTGMKEREWIRYPEPATITGLALAIGFESRQSVYDYEKDGQFSYTIKKARLRVEYEYEKKLTTLQSATGAIFALKNLGWIDKTEVKQEVKIEPKDYSNLSDDELKTLVDLQRKAIGE